MSAGVEFHAAAVTTAFDEMASTVAAMVVVVALCAMWLRRRRGR